MHGSTDGKVWREIGRGGAEQEGAQAGIALRGTYAHVKLENLRGAQRGWGMSLWNLQVFGRDLTELDEVVSSQPAGDSAVRPATKPASRSVPGSTLNVIGPSRVMLSLR